MESKAGKMTDDMPRAMKMRPNSGVGEMARSPALKQSCKGSSLGEAVRKVQADTRGKGY